MIFISSACVKHTKIKDSIQELAGHGFKNIELSGGTTYYDGFIDDLLEAKNKYNLNYICHNYFPPPINHFVVNLASLEDDVFNKTLNHLENSIELSGKLDTSKFGFHAGFFSDIPPTQIGKSISKKPLFDKEKSVDKFCNAFDSLNRLNQCMSLYIENNVLSYRNFKNFGENIFMLTNKQEYLDLIKRINFNLILDVAHLKVTCNSLNLNFEKELDYLFHKSDYIHVSDNNGFEDQNLGLQRGSSLYEQLSQYSFANKTVTIEVYESMSEVISTYKLISELMVTKK